ncbi:hypothetical protein MMC07_008998 [Pseudocyphellaria aurata]|nr:hypothetical protein [Pseudocyphellaria aurata]
MSAKLNPDILTEAVPALNNDPTANDKFLYRGQDPDIRQDEPLQEGKSVLRPLTLVSLNPEQNIQALRSQVEPGGLEDGAGEGIVLPSAGEIPSVVPSDVGIPMLNNIVPVHNRDEDPNHCPREVYEELQTPLCDSGKTDDVIQIESTGD